MTQAKSMSGDLIKIKDDIELIKNILMENYQLSDEAKAQLLKARKTPNKR